MNIITIIFMLGMFSVPMVVESSTLNAASEPLLGSSKFVGLAELPTGQDDGDYVPPIPLQDGESVASPVKSEKYFASPGDSPKDSPDRAPKSLPTPSKPLTPEERAKRFIKSVIGNDDAAFSSLFHGDPAQTTRLAHQRFTLPVNGVTVKHITALHLASKNGNEAMVRDLVENGADVTAKLSDGSTPLVVASKRGHVGVVDYLVSLPSKQDYVGSLHGAIAGGHLPLVKTLVHHIEYQPNDIDEGIAVAQETGKHDIAQYLTREKVGRQETAARNHILYNDQLIRSNVAEEEREEREQVPVLPIDRSEVSSTQRNSNVHRWLADVNNHHRDPLSEDDLMHSASKDQMPGSSDLVRF